MASYVYATLFGILGGVLNCMLFHNGFVLPYRENKDGRIRIDPGYIGNLILGGGAGFIMYGLGASEFPFPKMIAISFLSGIGGGSLIVNILQNKKIIDQVTEMKTNEKKIDYQKQQMELQKSKIDSLHKVAVNFNEVLKQLEIQKPKKKK